MLEHLILVYNTPSNVKAFNVSSDPDNSIRMTWTEPDKGGEAKTFDGFLILWKPPDNGGTVDVGSEKNEEIISLLKPNTNYNFEVAVEASNGLLGEISKTSQETSEQLTELV